MLTKSWGAIPDTGTPWAFWSTIILNRGGVPFGHRHLPSTRKMALSLPRVDRSRVKPTLLGGSQRFLMRDGPPTNPAEPSPSPPQFLPQSLLELGPVVHTPTLGVPFSYHTSLDVPGVHSQCTHLPWTDLPLGHASGSHSSPVTTASS